MKPIDKEIARQCFASLVLDYEYERTVVCRVLIDGNFYTTITATTIESAIDFFYSGLWKLD